MTGADAPGGPSVDGGELRPVVDDALEALGDRDREAVLLRFFEGWSWAEIGERLALTEDAARMRVDRALERMRGALARRGVTSTTAALGAALAGQAAAGVPAGLAASVAGAAVAGGGAAPAVFLMTLTKLQVAGVLALFAAGAAALVWQHRTNKRDRAALAEVPALRAENARLKTENRRLAEAGGGRNDTRSGAGVPVAAAVSAPPDPERAPERPVLAAGMIPVETLGNGGRATPRAAFATQLWAARAGETAVEAATILLEPEGRAKLEALMAALPADLRTQYEPPEKLMALALADNPHPVGGMRVLGETALDPDDVTLQTEWQHADDTIVHHSDVRMHRDDGGWKLVVPEILVDRAAVFLARRSGR